MKLIFFSILGGLILFGCGESNKFEKEIQKPEWFGTIDAPVIKSSAEVSALWQSEDRCCVDEMELLKNNRIFYKSCYDAVSNYYEDEGLVVKCLWLMDVGADSKQKIQLARFLVENFSHHKNSITDCVNCMPADTVARVTSDLAGYEQGSGNLKKAIDLIESLLDTRGSEISFWIQAEIYTSLGKMYLGSGVTSDRWLRFQEIYEKFNDVRKYNDPLERRYKAFEKIYLLVKAEAGESMPPVSKSSVTD